MFPRFCKKDIKEFGKKIRGGCYNTLGADGNICTHIKIKRAQKYVRGGG